MNFTKMHGCGNDGIFLDALREPAISDLVAGSAWDCVVRTLCDRQRGIGADTVILLTRAGAGAAGADAHMRIFNADGHEAQMCSTGVRGVAKLLCERHGHAADTLTIETGRGVLSVRVRRAEKGGKVTSVAVAMGAPILNPERIPVRLAGNDGRALGVPIPDDLLRIIGAYAHAAAVDPLMSCVSMGNPHTVLWCRDAGEISLAPIGIAFERHTAFPERINTHFVQVVSRREVIARHWERGVGASLACGTGACAIVVAGVLTGRLDTRVKVRVPGGEFEIEWPGEGESVVLTGPIETVFEGVIPL